MVREVLSVHPHAVVLYMSGYADLKPDPPGALLVKPLELDTIAKTVDRLVEERRLRAAQSSSS